MIDYNPYYQYADYIVINQNLTDPSKMISGDVAGDEIQWIRDNSHRVLGKKIGDGTMAVCQLNDSNSNLFYDGTSADLTGIYGSVYMRLPQFYYHVEELESDVYQVGFSRGRVGKDWIEWDGNDLIGAYKFSVKSLGFNESEIGSVSGIVPAAYMDHSGYNSYIRSLGEGFSLVKLRHHSIMALLFYAYYGTTNSQDVIGYGNNTVRKTTGNTNSMGMNDTSKGRGSINFWGLENWWQDLSEIMDGVVVNSSVLYITNDDGYSYTYGPIGSGLIKKIIINEFGILLPKEIEYGGDESTCYCDYVMGSAGNGMDLNRSGNSDAGTYGILAYVVNSANNSSGTFGSRITFRGDIVSMSSSEFVLMSKS